MMRKLLIWTGILLGSLLGLIVLTTLGLSFRTNSRLNKTYTIQIEPVPVPTDAGSIEEGSRLASIYCTGCHGPDLSGKEFFNDPAIAVIDAPNLTQGAGGVGGQYSDVDWVRAIRHGVNSQGQALFIMPSKDFYYFSDQDLGNLIAYLKNVQAVNNESDDFNTTLMGRILVGAGAFGDVINAETIDHTQPRPRSPEPSISVEYGDYLVKTFGCRTCHGEELAGGLSPDPDSPSGPNLTPGGNLSHWSQQDFIIIIRNRKSEWMPFESLNKMSDDELTAIYLYLQALPALETVTK